MGGRTIQEQSDAGTMHRSVETMKMKPDCNKEEYGKKQTTGRWERSLDQKNKATLWREDLE